MTIRATRSSQHNKTVKVTANYTIVNEEIVYVDTTGGAVTITLPPIQTGNGTVGGRRSIRVIDSGGMAGTNAITVSRAGSNTINGGTSFTIGANYGQGTFTDDGGSDWIAPPVSSADEAARVSGQPSKATLSPAAGTSNVCLVTIQVTDGSGNNIAAPITLVVTLSDAATGAGLTATTASGAVAAGTAGADLGDLTAKKAKVVQTDATGKYILSITDTAKTGFYVVANIPGLKPFVSAQLVTGNYG